MKRLIALLLAMLLLLSTVLCACEKDEEPEAPSQTDPTSATEAEEETVPSGEEEEFVFSGTLDASCFTAYMEDFTGEVDGESFTGVRMKTVAYQPNTFVTKPAMKALRLYARENGYDGLRIHAHIDQTNNSFMVGDKYFANGEWGTVDISLGNFFTFTQFWSQSESETDNYLWFEFVKLPVINVTSFTDYVSEFSGEIGGETFDGFVFKSADYQPTTWFNEWTVEDIKAYAKENDFNALRVHAYAQQLDNGFVVCGRYFGLNQWCTVDLSIEDMTPETMYFWSQSQGTTENYLWFEFVNSNNLFIPSLTVSGGGPTYANTNPYFRSNVAFSATSFKGTIDGETFDGFRLQSADYQPFFYLTEKGVNMIYHQAEEAGANIVRIHAYPILFNNGFVVGPQWQPNKEWSVTEIALTELTTETAFWSQSEGLTDVYLWFEYIYLDIPDRIGPINAGFFEGANGSVVGVSDYKGEAHGEIINGVRVQSSDYQPYFKFTNDGLAKIRKFAEDNHYNFLRIHSHATLFDNGFLIGSVYTAPDVWNTTDIAIEDLDGSFLFWSQSQGLTDIFFWFEWYHADIPPAIGPVGTDFFEGIGSSVGTTRYRGEAGGMSINGLKVQSADYQPYFRFTDSAITQIKQFAKEKGFNTLILHTYAILYDNGFMVGETYTPASVWSTTELPLEKLDGSFKFWSQSQGVTEVYFWFDYKEVKVDPYGQIIHAGSFAGAGVKFADYQGEAGGTSITGLKVTSADYQPHFKLTAAAVEAINTYAKENGFTNVTVHAYAILKDNSFVIGNTYWFGNGVWSTATIPVSALTTSLDFWSQSQGTTEIYMWFEFS